MITKTQTLITILTLIISTITYGSGHSPQTNNSFSYMNRPVNPACLALFNGSEADMPFITEINLSTCQNANASAHWSGKGTSFKQGDTTYAYKVIGETLNHIYVLETTLSTGGSGIFQSILLCRMRGKNHPVWNDQQNQFNPTTYTALTYVGLIPGGDRFTGSFKNLRVEGNKIIGQRYSTHNTPNDNAKPLVNVTFDLTGQ